MNMQDIIKENLRMKEDLYKCELTLLGLLKTNGSLRIKKENMEDLCKHEAVRRYNCEKTGDIIYDIVKLI